MKAETTSATEDDLSILCKGNEELHDAMSYFLYLRPEDQIARLGTTEQLIQRAKEEAGRGDLLKARADYVDAAWIEMYKGNKSNVKVFLERASSLGDGDGLARLYNPRLHTLLLNLGEVMAIAKLFYHQDETRVETEPTEPRAPILELPIAK